MLRALFALGLAASAASAPGGPERIRLADDKGGPASLEAYAGARAVVVVMHGQGCPIVRRSLGELEALRARFEPRGAAIVLLDSNRRAQPDRSAAEARAFGWKGPVLFDRDQVLAGALGADRTAEAFVLRPPAWNVAYRGAIDDSQTYGAQRPARERFLAEALEAALDGRPAKTARTAAFGCLIAMKRSKS